MGWSGAACVAVREQKITAAHVYLTANCGRMEVENTSITKGVGKMFKALRWMSVVVLVLTTWVGLGWAVHCGHQAIASYKHQLTVNQQEISRLKGQVNKFEVKEKTVCENFALIPLNNK